MIVRTKYIWLSSLFLILVGGPGQELLPRNDLVLSLFLYVLATMFCALGGAGVFLVLRSRINGVQALQFGRSRQLVFAGILGSIFAAAFMYFYVVGGSHAPFIPVLAALPGIGAGLILMVYVLRAQPAQSLPG